MKIVTAVLLALAAAAVVADDYRLAGTIALGDERYLALIEMPSGEQQIFRVGDEFEGGEIARITRTAAYVERPGGDLVLDLTGMKLARSGAVEPGLVVGTLELGAQQLDLVMALRASDEKALTAALTEGLDLPKGLKVRRVMAGVESYDSLTEALPDLQRALAEGEAPHLFFEEGEGLDELYLVAERE